MTKLERWRHAMLLAVKAMLETQPHGFLESQQETVNKATDAINELISEGENDINLAGDRDARKGAGPAGSSKDSAGTA